MKIFQPGFLKKYLNMLKSIIGTALDIEFQNHLEGFSEN